jgi:hypothetical protein
MKYFHFNGEINEKSLDDFLQFINENFTIIDYKDNEPLFYRHGIY